MSAKFDAETIKMKAGQNLMVVLRKALEENDEFSRQVRRDTLRFRIDEIYRIGKC